MSSLEHLKQPICKDRIRKIAGQGFAFIPHRFLKDGFLGTLGPDELSLYVFLLLAANPNGVSFYSYDSICAILNMHLDLYLAARNQLIEKDLIAFDGRRFQVLSLPDHPKPLPEKSFDPQENFQDDDPAAIRSLILKELSNPSKTN